MIMPKAAVPISSHFENRWVQEMTNMYIMEYGAPLDVDFVKAQLHQVFQSRAYNPRMRMVNNYSNRVAETGLIQLYDYIAEKKPVISGNGCLFQQHSRGFNPETAWIIGLMDRRKVLKKKMFQAMVAGNDALYNVYYRLQLNTKIKINSLYGATGYVRFILYNLYLAQAVTAYGQMIISTAAQTFEAFIADNYNFLDSTTVYGLIRDCVKESVRTDEQVILRDERIGNVTVDEVFGRVMQQIVFPTNPQFENSLRRMLENCDEYALKLIYYKNNLRGLFSRNPELKEILRSYLVNLHSESKDKDDNTIIIPTLMEPNKGALVSESAEVNDLLWRFIKLFVLYKEPIYDRVRKTKYQYKKAVSYIDTDSNFLCLDPWFVYLNENVFHPEDMPQTIEEKDQRTYAIANTFNVWISDVVHTMFGIMTGNFNVDPEIGKRLNMKSEVLYSRIVFVDVKKRYLGKMKLKEGNVVPPKKQADFKGFDFMKSTTKPFLKEYYIKLSMEKILSPDVISPRDVFRAILLFKRQIEEDLENGETKYYKQANIKRIEEYAERAYSTQGIKAVTLWNTLNPDYQIQLPSDVDIVPMRWEEGRKTKEGPKVIQDHYVYVGKKLKKTKDGGTTEVDVYQDNDTPVLRELQEKYPETYQILNDRIFHNENPNIRKMGIQWMAKPKNPNIPVPAWYYDFVDSATIVDDALKLYYPVLESIGLNIAKVSTNKTCLTNMVSL